MADDMAYVADVYYSHTSWTGNIDESGAAVVVATDPTNDAEIDEWDFDSTSWATSIQSAESALGTDPGEMRGSHHSVSSAAIVDGSSASGITMYKGPLANYKQDPCGDLKFAAEVGVGYTATLAIVGGIASFFSAGFFGDIAVPAVVDSTKATIALIVIWKACEANGGIAMFTPGAGPGDIVDRLPPCDV